MWLSLCTVGMAIGLSLNALFQGPRAGQPKHGECLEHKREPRGSRATQTVRERFVVARGGQVLANVKHDPHPHRAPSCLSIGCLTNLP